MGNKTENATVKTAAFINNENRNNKNIFVKKNGGAVKLLETISNFTRRRKWKVWIDCLNKIA